MSFMKVGEAPIKKQRLYLMEIVLPSGITVVKVGKASGNSSVNRMMQIVESIYNKFRKTPMIYIKRDQEVPIDMVFKYETILHQFFQNYQYQTKQKWSGCTEAFCVPLDDALIAFNLVCDGVVPEHTYELPEVAEDKLQF